MKQGVIIRGRLVTSDDVDLIRSLIDKYFKQGRTFISRELCRHWNWYQPNGALKDMACRELLRRLEKKGFVTLPPSRKKNHQKGRNLTIPPHETHPIEGKLKTFLPIKLLMVRGSPQETLFNGLIHKYHYLRYCQIVGPSLKYVAFIKAYPVACLGWGAAAWKVACRDQFIGWSSLVRKKNLSLIINNTRFLILPWVHIPNLASHLLSQNIKTISRDWQRLYNYQIALLETFVDTKRFEGTSYKAANWIYAGITKGRGKNDRYNQYPVSVKSVFLYPLITKFREVLGHE